MPTRPRPPHEPLLAPVFSVVVPLSLSRPIPGIRPTPGTVVRRRRAALSRRAQCPRLTKRRREPAQPLCRASTSHHRRRRASPSSSISTWPLSLPRLEQSRPTVVGRPVVSPPLPSLSTSPLHAAVARQPARCAARLLSGM
jgi:hypothetical protein